MVSDMGVNQEVQPFDIVTGFFFFLTSMLATFGAWRHSVKRVRAYSHDYARHKARRFPLSAQLRFAGKSAADRWIYSMTW
jgi:hypothetical protein